MTGCRLTGELLCELFLSLLCVLQAFSHLFLSLNSVSCTVVACAGTGYWDLIGMGGDGHDIAT